MARQLAAIKDGGFVVDEGENLTMLVADLLTNDKDPFPRDAKPLRVASVLETAKTRGGVMLNGDGTVTYTPDPGYSGLAAILYCMTNGKSGFDAATVAVTAYPAEDPDPEPQPCVASVSDATQAEDGGTMVFRITLDRPVPAAGRAAGPQALPAARPRGPRQASAARARQRLAAGHRQGLGAAPAHRRLGQDRVGVGDLRGRPLRVGRPPRRRLRCR